MIKRAKITVCVTTVLATLALGSFGTAFAEEVRTPLMSKAERGTQENLPRKGMSESSVRNRWGAPRETVGPVGEPPISQWRYDGFVVYFEGDRVIHSVLTQ